MNANPLTINFDFADVPSIFDSQDSIEPLLATQPNSAFLHAQTEDEITALSSSAVIHYSSDITASFFEDLFYQPLESFHSVSTRQPRPLESIGSDDEIMEIPAPLRANKRKRKPKKDSQNKKNRIGNNQLVTTTDYSKRISADIIGKLVVLEIHTDTYLNVIDQLRVLGYSADQINEFNKIIRLANKRSFDNIMYLNNYTQGRLFGKELLGLGLGLPDILKIADHKEGWQNLMMILNNIDTIKKLKIPMSDIVKITNSNIGYEDLKRFICKADNDYLENIRKHRVNIEKVKEANASSGRAELADLYSDDQLSYFEKMTPPGSHKKLLKLNHLLKDKLNPEQIFKIFCQLGAKLIEKMNDHWATLILHLTAPEMVQLVAGRSNGFEILMLLINNWDALTALIPEKKDLVNIGSYPNGYKNLMMLIKNRETLISLGIPTSTIVDLSNHKDGYQNLLEFINIKRVHRLSGSSLLAARLKLLPLGYSKQQTRKIFNCINVSNFLSIHYHLVDKLNYEQVTTIIGYADGLQALKAIIHNWKSLVEFTLTPDDILIIARQFNGSKILVKILNNLELLRELNIDKIGILQIIRHNFGYENFERLLKHQNRFKEMKTPASEIVKICSSNVCNSDEGFKDLKNFNTSNKAYLSMKPSIGTSTNLLTQIDSSIQTNQETLLYGNIVANPDTIQYVYHAPIMAEVVNSTANPGLTRLSLFKNSNSQFLTIPIPEVQQDANDLSCLFGKPAW